MKRLDPMDALRTVLADTDDPPMRYRGKARIKPFIQGGHYWREESPAAALQRHLSDGKAHFAGIAYIENERGQGKHGYRELRGDLKLWQEGGAVWIGRDAEKWMLVNVDVTQEPAHSRRESAGGEA